MAFEKVTSIGTLYKEKIAGELISTADWNSNFNQIDSNVRSNVTALNNNFDLLASKEGSKQIGTPDGQTMQDKFEKIDADHTSTLNTFANYDSKFTEIQTDITEKANETAAAKNAAESAKDTAVAAASNAQTSEANAAASETTVKDYHRVTESLYKSTAILEKATETAANDAIDYASKAETSATNAATSETNAKTSEANAKVSKTNAANSASAAATSEVNAKTSETNAANSEAKAKTSETNAATSEKNAATYAANAKTSETNAASSATKAATSEANAASSATAAATSAETAKAATDSKMDKNNPVGTGSFAMNMSSGATLGEYAHVEGYDGIASGKYAHTEGYYNYATGEAAHAENSQNRANGDYSHAEGFQTTSKGEGSHAEGCSVYANGNWSHAECFYTRANGNFSHAEGNGAKANGEGSHAEGLYTIASGEEQHAQGRANIEDTEGKYAHIVGNGYWDTTAREYHRSNAHTLDWSGNAWFAGTVKMAEPTAEDDATTKKYVDETAATNKAEIDSNAEAIKARATNDTVDNLLVPGLIQQYGMDEAFKLFVEANAPYDTLTSCVERFFSAAAKSVNETYTSQFYNFDVSSSTYGTKLDDNASLTCKPSTNDVAEQDDYAKLPLFACYDVDYTIDADTLEPVIHAIKGIYGDFSKAPTDSLVGVIQMAGWVKRTRDETYKTLYYRAKAESGYSPLPEAVRASDNSVRPYVLHAKYAAGYNANGLLSSVSGVQPAAYISGRSNHANTSHDGQISYWKKWGDQYCGCSLADYAFLQTMLEIKYACLGNNAVMTGATSYYLTYSPAVAETGVTRVVMTTSNASGYVVGSTVSVGTSSDRSDAACYSTVEFAKILSKESVEIDGTTYTALNLDVNAAFDTTTSLFVATQPWQTGSTDSVQGNDGSSVDCKNVKNLFKIQGIEVMLGQYEIPGDTTLYYDGTNANVYLNRKASEIKAGGSGTNPVTVGTITQPATTAWLYNAEVNWLGGQEGLLLQKQAGGGSSNAYMSAQYIQATGTTGWREWQAFGNLWNGSVYGLCCAILGDRLGNTNWLYGARACGSGGNRGEATPQA